MVKEIVKDIEVLKNSCGSIKYNEEICKQIIIDLKDSAKYYAENHSDGCAGLAANQIGYNNRVIICSLKHHNGRVWKTMINPVISKRSRETHISIEGCLSLDGKREVLRYNAITVIYTDEYGKAKKESYIGFDACVIQHEIDHLNGKLI